ncbi:HlyD family type I secretion periplasmic adaptor subunit [Sulfitobacter sp.]|jgi:membrane fusion protein, type I secretion system|uniref:HlyD family type I secretion periplasmic adaptor subunit n=1 Tax=Sulfitobacter sp. TaxID=1903071 RepID=UPI0026B3E39A|tara:strand:+ start:1867 stop:3180 length:1314 start_codon:yes stop_codon:yes gene_type:complete
MREPELSKPETSLRGLITVAVVSMILLIGVLGGWAATTEISGAVIAHGRVEVAGKPKVVQSLDGGVVSELSVRNGDTVQAGQIIARLDPTFLQINLEMARTRLVDVSSRQARLEAESTNAKEISFDFQSLPFEVAQARKIKAMAGQQEIFSTRAKIRTSLRERMESNVKAIETQTKGYTEQIEALEKQIAYLDEDLQSAVALVAKGLSRQTQLTQIRRQRAALSGELAGRQAELANLKHRKWEFSLELLQNEQRFQEQVATERHEVTAEFHELKMAIIARQAQLERVNIRAPVDGIVHELQVTTIGGIVAAGGTLMNVIPQQSGFEFEARVSPQSISLVHENQKAQITLSTLTRQNALPLSGKVSAISPEAITDRVTGEVFYRVALEISPEELASLPKTTKLIAGMLLEAFLHTEQRTVLSYLIAPLGTQLRRSFRS